MLNEVECCFRNSWFVLLALVSALVPPVHGSDSELPVGVVRSSGFCPNGVYGVMEWPGGARPDGLSIWGSFCDQADDNVGRLESQYFLAPSVLHLYLAGYPGLPGRRLLLKHVRSGEERELTPSSLPREKWQYTSLTVPPEWIGKQVQFVAVDQATGPLGWMGFSLPVLPVSSLAPPVVGFCPDGVYGTTKWPFGGHPKGLATWGSFCKAGDAGTGWAASRPFHAGPDIRIYIAGYPGTPDLSLALEDLRNGRQFPLLPPEAPAESWQLHHFRLPAEWSGQLVRVVARDQATGLRGWVAFSEPVPEGLLEKAFDAAEALGMILLLAAALLLPSIVACILLALAGVENVVFLAATALLTLAAVFWFYCSSQLRDPANALVDGCAGLLAAGSVLVYFGLAKNRGLKMLRAAFWAARRKCFILALIWGLAAIAILPVVFHWTAPLPYTGSAGDLRIGLGYLAALAICYGMFRVESRRLTRSQALSLVFVVFLLTSITNNLHRFNVDHGVYIFSNLPNWKWQNTMHDAIIQLAPGALPHSYRFLPNAIVRWMQLAHIDFESARDLYRLLAGLLVFYAIYYYARLYASYTGAIVAMLFSAVIYPVSFENYAGQLTDPLSHLSFVLALICLETGQFALLLSTLVIGSLAKETVLAMVGYYLIFCRQERQYRLKAALLCLAGAAAYFGVRLFVLHGSMSYRQTSGVGLEHISENWYDPLWSTPFLLTSCALLPFVALAWKETPASLKRQTLFLFPVLFISGLFFSWLRESRNFMPLVFVLAVIAGGYFSRQLVEPRRHELSAEVATRRKETEEVVSGD